MTREGELLLGNQQETIIGILVELLQMIEAYRGRRVIDTTSLGIEITVASGYQPDLDARLRPWKDDPWGQAVRQGIRRMGEIVAPHVTFTELDDIAHEASTRSGNADLSLGIFNSTWDGLRTSDGRIWSA